MSVRRFRTNFTTLICTYWGDSGYFVAEEAIKTTAYEDFVAEKVSEDRSIFGLYPATEESRTEFQTYRNRSQG
ncbi:MAG: hypothetical protein OEU36_06990 [Gammaproteobacteria bacterium]|nr:hypothetical protein [Gammaproteobacteria bacterium]